MNPNFTPKLQPECRNSLIQKLADIATNAATRTSVATYELNSHPVLSNEPLRALNASIHFLPTGLIPNAVAVEITARLKRLGGFLGGSVLLTPYRSN
jgi:hypothetical protein